MVFRDLLLHLRRLLRALSARETTGNDRWEDDSRFPVSQGVLLGMSAIMIIPSLMPFLSLVLPAAMNRWANVVFGALYTVVMILAIIGSWHFYIVYGLIEIILTALIVWYAWTWPKQPTRE
jgi:hypothetical protein